MEKLILHIEEPVTRPIVFNANKCIGCNRCINICQVDVLLPNIKKGETPIVQFPSECWYCGSCVMECSIEGAIALKHPLMNQVHWVEKKKLTGGNE